MTVSYASGDLFDQKTWVASKDQTYKQAVDCIGHGVNCKGVMGSGIAVLFRKAYPEMYAKYKFACDNGLLLPGQVMPWTENGLTIFNIASQYNPGAGARLPYLEVGLQYVHFYMEHNQYKHLALPRIGAGIGGLMWDNVVEVIDFVFSKSNKHVTLVSLPE